LIIILLLSLKRSYNINQTTSGRSSTVNEIATLFVKKKIRKYNEKIRKIKKKNTGDIKTLIRHYLYYNKINSIHYKSLIMTRRGYSLMFF